HDARLSRNYFLRLQAAALWNQTQCHGLLLELTVLLIERETRLCRAIFSISDSVNGSCLMRRASICRADQPPAMRHWRPCATWPAASAEPPWRGGHVGWSKGPMRGAAPPAPRPAPPPSTSSRRIGPSAPPNTPRRSSRPRSTLLVKPRPRQHRLFGRAGPDT